MKCNKCGAENQMGKFCSECGSPLVYEADESPKSHPVKICPNCGDMLLPQVKKCPTCGKNVSECKILDRNNTMKIKSAILKAPHAKSSLKPKWQDRLDAKEALWKKENKPSKCEIIKNRIKDNKANGIACCPKCGSTSISANKKGFGVGKAVVGGYLAGPIGLMAGNIHAKKVRVTCLNCGHQWMV